ncbi:unnamed protein product [Paramecium primaurelia]|uniref:Uncharacterized protein n=1 Tax=Paramecium primaurelia TaxID=5886 RepID=A0A8S1L5V4_PARPR|nr:unnamed protein product [Paramecium primaurelia]
MTSGGNHIQENSRIYPRLPLILHLNILYHHIIMIGVQNHHTDYLSKLPLQQEQISIEHSCSSCFLTFAIRIKLFAFQDSSISVITFQQNDVQELQTGTGIEQQRFQKIKSLKMQQMDQQL